MATVAILSTHTGNSNDAILQELEDVQHMSCADKCAMNGVHSCATEVRWSPLKTNLLTRIAREVPYSGKLWRTINLVNQSPE